MLLDHLTKNCVTLCTRHLTDLQNLHHATQHTVNANFPPALMDQPMTILFPIVCSLLPTTLTPHVIDFPDWQSFLLMHILLNCVCILIANSQLTYVHVFCLPIHRVKYMRTCVLVSMLISLHTPRPVHSTRSCKSATNKARLYTATYSFRYITLIAFDYINYTVQERIIRSLCVPFTS